MNTQAIDNNLSEDPIWATRIEATPDVYDNSNFPSYLAKLRLDCGVPIPSEINTKHIDTWNLLISNLYRSARHDMWLRISLNKNYYSRVGVSYTHLREALVYLVSGNHIESVKGYHKACGFGLVSAFRFKETSSIYRDLCAADAQKQLAWEVSPLKKALIVKDGKKEVEVNSDELKALIEVEKSLLESWEAQLDKHDICLTEVSDPYIESITSEREDGNRDIRHLLSSRIIYNSADLSKGGRIYNLLQNMKKENRSFIKIDGEETTELDFSNLHINILANMSGHRLDFDAYSVNTHLGVGRTTQKRILNRILNSKEASKSLRYSLADYGYAKDEVDVTKYMENLVSAMPFLKAALGTPKIGLNLMKIEADIMKEIMATCVAADYVILPIHDGLVCKASEAAKITQIMYDAYTAVLNRIHNNCPITVKVTN